ncbi:MAG: hypothetical protein EBX40_04730 [Gammaproteobacteria bacterium]|nr:hypothetical protein [Gammaproteobacteria bacterium]
MGLIYPGVRNRAELSNPTGGVIKVMRGMWEGPQRRNLIQGEAITNGLASVPDANQPPSTWLIAQVAGRIAATQFVTGTSTQNAALTAIANLTNAVSGTSALTGTLTANANLSVTFGGTTAIAANITAAINASGVISGSSVITANLTTTGTAQGVATLTGTSTVSATLIAKGSLSAGIVVNNVCLSATDVADAVWDAPINSHILGGSFGEQVLKLTNADILADIILRRETGKVEQSSYGDVLTLRSLYGMIAQAVHNTQVSGTTLSVTQSDDTTVLGTRTVTLDPAAQPITGLNSD